MYHSRIKYTVLKLEKQNITVKVSQKLAAFKLKVSLLAAFS